jgi:hypothetical protein
MDDVVSRRFFTQALAAAGAGANLAPGTASKIAQNAIPSAVGLIFPDLAEGKAVSVANVIDAFCKFKRLYVDPQNQHGGLSVDGFFQDLFNGTLSAVGDENPFMVYAARSLQASLLAQQEMAAANALLFQSTNRYGAQVTAIVAEYETVTAQVQSEIINSFADIVLDPTFFRTAEIGKLHQIQELARTFKTSSQILSKSERDGLFSQFAGFISNRDSSPFAVVERFGELLKLYSTNREEAINALAKKHDISAEDLKKIVELYGQLKNKPVLNPIEQLHRNFIQKIHDLNTHLRENYPQFSIPTDQVNGLAEQLFEQTARRLLPGAQQLLSRIGHNIVQSNGGPHNQHLLESGHLPAHADRHPSRLNAPPNGAPQPGIEAAKPNETETAKFQKLIAEQKARIDELEKQTWNIPREYY